MPGPSTLERGTADRGVTTDPDVVAARNEERDLRRRITDAVRDRGSSLVTSIEIRARDAVNNVIPLRKIWATGEWNDPWSRWIFLRVYLTDLHSFGGAGPSETLTEAELVRRILVEEREYQRLARVSGDRWIAHRIERNLSDLAEREYNEYLQLIRDIRNEIVHRQQIRPMQVPTQQMKSTIFRASGAATPLLRFADDIERLLKAGLDLFSLTLDFVPIIGQIKGIAEAALGKDLITGRDLAIWERGLSAGLSLLPFARGVFRAGRTAVRGAGAVVRGTGRGSAAAGRFAMGHLAALAVRLGDRVDPRALFRAMQGLSRASREALLAAAKVPAGKPLTAVQQEAVAAVARFSADAAGAPAVRTVSGVIDGGRGTTRAASGEVAARRVAPAPAAAARAAAATRPLSKAAQALVGKGYAAEALRILDDAGVRLTARLVKRLDALGEAGREFVNRFHRCPGFEHVVLALGRGRGAEIGAAFVMRYVTGTADIVRKVQADPMLIAFERGATISKSRTAERFGREVDVVVRGDRTIGAGTTIYTELKSWTRFTLGRAAKSPTGTFAQQFVRDSTVQREIRWVFDSTKLSKPEVLDTFVTIIQRDGYLKSKWGSDAATIRAALENVVTMFP